MKIVNDQHEFEHDLMLICCLLYGRIFTSLDSNDTFLCALVSPCSIEAAINSVNNTDTIELVDSIIDTDKKLEQFLKLVKGIIKKEDCILNAYNNCKVIIRNRSNLNQSLFFLNSTTFHVRNFNFQLSNNSNIFDCINSSLYLENCSIINSKINQNIITSHQSNIFLNNFTITSTSFYCIFMENTESNITITYFYFDTNIIITPQSTFNIRNSNITISSLYIANNKFNTCSLLFIKECNVSITNSTLTNNANHKSLITLSDNSNLNISNSIFKGNYGNIITLSNKSTICMTNSMLLSNFFSYNGLVSDQTSLISAFDSSLHFFNLIVNHNSYSYALFDFLSSYVSFIASQLHQSSAEYFIIAKNSSLNITTSIFSNINSQISVYNSLCIIYLSSIISCNIITYKTNNNYKFNIFNGATMSHNSSNSESFIESCTFTRSIIKESDIRKLNYNNFDKQSTVLLPLNIIKNCKQCVFNSYNENGETISVPVKSSILNSIIATIIIMSSTTIMLIWVYRKVKYYSLFKS